MLGNMARIRLSIADLSKAKRLLKIYGFNGYQVNLVLKTRGPSLKACLASYNRSKELNIPSRDSLLTITNPSKICCRFCPLANGHWSQTRLGDVNTFQKQFKKILMDCILLNVEKNVKKAKQN